MAQDTSGTERSARSKGGKEGNLLGESVCDVSEAGDGDVGEFVSDGEEFVLNVCAGGGKDRIGLRNEENSK